MLIKRKLFTRKPRMSVNEYVDKYLKNATEKAGYLYNNSSPKNIPANINVDILHDPTNINGFAISTNPVKRVGIVGMMPHESIDDFSERISKPTDKIDKILNDAENARKLRLERLRKVEKIKHQRVVGKRLKKLGKVALVVGGVGTAAYLAKKYNDKKKSEKNQ